MTIRELAQNLIEHADETPVEKIDIARAAEIIGWLDKDSDLPEDLTPEAFMAAFNDILDEYPGGDPEDAAPAEKTMYTAVIEADDGIHLIRKAISDPTGEYEDFEYAMQNKADDLGGELHVIYCDEDIVEDTTLE